MAAWPSGAPRIARWYPSGGVRRSTGAAGAAVSATDRAEPALMGADAVQGADVRV